MFGDNKFFGNIFATLGFFGILLFSVVASAYSLFAVIFLIFIVLRGIFRCFKPARDIYRIGNTCLYEGKRYKIVDAWSDGKVILEDEDGSTFEAIVKINRRV